MIVSWNELQRTCQKAFRGLGVPAGVDDDGSFAVLWLQARGFDALTPLDAALSALERAPPRPLRLGRREDGVDVLDAGGQPAVSVASDALDFALARLARHEVRTEVLLTGVDGGLLVAGALAQRPMPGHRACVEWREHNLRRRLEVASNGERRVCTAPFDPGERHRGLGCGTARIVLDGPTRDRWMALDAAWRIDIDEAELHRRAAHSVTHGIEVPVAPWTRLLAFAERTLVPATHASRERGAGGGSYND